MEAAIDECQVDGVEFDIHVTADGVLILQHDETLDRMTNGNGLIASQPWKNGIDQLKTKHDKYPDLPVTTFSDAMQALLVKTASFKQKFAVIIDIKDDQEIRVLDALAAELAALLPAESGHNLDIFLGCWCDKFTEHLRALTLPAGVHVTWIGEGLTVERSTHNYYDSYDVNIDLLEAEPLQKAREQGKTVFVWTCNEREQVDKAKGLGVHGILTDNPLLI